MRQPTIHHKTNGQIAPMALQLRVNSPGLFDLAATLDALTGIARLHRIEIEVQEWNGGTLWVSPSGNALLFNRNNGLIASFTRNETGAWIEYRTLQCDA